MTEPSKLTLAEARKQGKLDEFIAEREAESQPDADRKAFDDTVKAMAGKSSATPATSPKGSTDD